jgi:2-C-methyl-D-erythritol 4-phosphate cytidylyltransferase
MNHFTSLILLAGGQGTRMGKGLPKQFRLLGTKTLALYSYEFFDKTAQIDEIIVVCPATYQSLFYPISKPVRFALPGARRQDSAYLGLLAAHPKADLICIHDAARPFIDAEAFTALLKQARSCDAAALATRSANTIKQCDEHQRVKQTLPRHELWELQTPQAIRRDLLIQAYEHAYTHNIEATDDLSLVEELGIKPTLVEGSRKNFKLTTPFDWFVAECALN